MITDCKHFALGASLLAIGLSLAVVDVQFSFTQALAAKGGNAGKSSHGNGVAGRGNESGDGDGDGNGRGDIASALGSLNASHASPEALAHAAPGSVVGEIAAYKTAVEAYLMDQANLQSLLTKDPGCASAACKSTVAAETQDLQSAESALSAAANKPVTARVVAAVDSNLGLTVAPATESEIASAITK
jgi:hypothetical protein